jgi:hypothetical protein
MDHQEAIRLGAVEKYLLDELPPPQRAEFEEHYFTCPECAQDLRLTAEFLDTARKELGRGTMGGTTPQKLKRTWLELFWRPAVLAPAFALAMAVIIYQNAVVLPRFSGAIAQLKRPALVAAISLIGSNSRGESAVATGSAGQPVLLSLDIPATQQFVSYACVLIDSSGTALLRVPVSAAQAQDTVSISVPAGNLRPGNYVLVVQGLPPHGGPTHSIDLARYRFTLTPSTQDH